MAKNPPAIGRPGLAPWVGKIPCRRAWQPTPVFLPGVSPWTEEPGGLQCVGLRRVRHDSVPKYSRAHILTNKDQFAVYGKSSQHHCFKARAIYSYDLFKIKLNVITLEKEVATQPSTLAWKTPWTKERGRLWSMGSQRVRHD